MPPLTMVCVSLVIKIRKCVFSRFIINRPYYQSLKACRAIGNVLDESAQGHTGIMLILAKLAHF